MIQTLTQLSLFFITLVYSFWSNLLIIPLFVCSNLYRLTTEIIRDTFTIVYCFLAQLAQKLSIYRLLRSILDWLKHFKSAIYRDREYPNNPLLRQSRTEQQIAATFMRAAASPDEITENEKVLLLMQKMRKLEETIFQQSNDRRRAETELFEIKSQLQQKNADLTKERSECVENMNKISLLKFQISQKNELLEKSTKHVVILQAQIKEMKERMEQLVVEKQKSERNRSNIQKEYQEEPESHSIKIPELNRAHPESEQLGSQNSIGN